MVKTVFVEIQFWLLVLFSIIVPVAIYIGLLKRRNHFAQYCFAVRCGVTADFGCGHLSVASIE
jgi:Ni/Fe-hydrogenase subunit HybB-like protein